MLYEVITNIASAMGGLTPDSIASSQEGKQIVMDAVEEIAYGANTVITSYSIHYTKLYDSII